MQARYAHLDATPGTAVLTDDRRVMFFSATDGTSRQLSNADIPSLTLLGTVSLAEEQALVDQLRGGATAMVCDAAERLRQER